MLTSAGSKHSPVSILQAESGQSLWKLQPTQVLVPASQMGVVPSQAPSLASEHWTHSEPLQTGVVSSRSAQEASGSSVASQVTQTMPTQNGMPSGHSSLPEQPVEVSVPVIVPVVVESVVLTVVELVVDIVPDIVLGPDEPVLPVLAVPMHSGSSASELMPPHGE